MDNPRYTVLVVIDEPHGIKKTFNYATGGWVAAPVVGRIIRRMGPIVGIGPTLNVEFKTPKITKDTDTPKQVNVKRQKHKLIKRISWQNPTILKKMSNELFLTKMRTVLERDVANH
jgi:hypothetical protein